MRGRACLGGKLDLERRERAAPRRYGDRVLLGAPHAHLDGELLAHQHACGHGDLHRLTTGRRSGVGGGGGLVSVGSLSSLSGLRLLSLLGLLGLLSLLSLLGLLSVLGLQDV